MRSGAQLPALAPHPGFVAWEDLRSTVDNCSPVDMGGDLWVERGALGVLPNKLWTPLIFRIFSRAFYKSGMGLVCISKLSFREHSSIL